MSKKRGIGRRKYLKMGLGAAALAVAAGASYVALQTMQLPKPPTTGNPRISVKWLGHASFQITTGDKTIYIDPYEGEYEDKADLILVTHSHRDHCGTSQIKTIRRDDTLVIAPADCTAIIGEPIKSLNPGEKTTTGNIVVEAVEAYNDKRFHPLGEPYHPKGLGVGYILTIEDTTIYHAGDTDFIPEMENLGNIYLALLPTGGIYAMDNPEAAEAALAINPRYVIPMQRWDTDPNEFKQEVEAKSEIKVILLNPGEKFDIE